MKLSVRCSNTEKAKLFANPALHESERAKLNRVLKEGLDRIPTDFLANMALRDAAKPGGQADPDRLSEWATRGRSLWEGYLAVDADGLAAREPPTNDISERAGEAAAVLFAEDIFEVTAADFTRIPEPRGRKAKGLKVFDFRAENVGVLNDRLLQIEAKATYNGVSTQTHASSIRNKKASPSVSGVADATKNIRIGFVLDVRKDPKETVLEVIDPPADESEVLDFSLLKYLKRCYFYLTILRAAWKGHMAVALTNRLDLLLQGVVDFNASNRIPLLRASGEPFFLPDAFASRTLEFDGDTIHGRIVASHGKDKGFSFLGIHREVAQVLADQDYTRIRELAFEPRGRIVKMPIATEEDLRRRRFITGTVWLTKAGVAFGSLA